MKLHVRLTIALSLPTTLLINHAVRAQTPTTERASISSSGGQANGDCWFPALSADGRFVAFSSTASSLAAGDTNGGVNLGNDVFVHDHQTGVTERVSVSTAGVEGNNNSGGDPLSISADGRFVAFGSAANNLVAGDTNGFSDAFVRDRQLGITERVSVSTAGAQGNNFTWGPSLSADGRFVAFVSRAGTLVAGYGGASTIFVRDRQLGTTECISFGLAGAPSNGNSDSPSISADGRFVAFFSTASNLVAGDTGGFFDIFVRDRQNGTTERVSVNSAGLAAFGNSYLGTSISADGRFVAFRSTASNLDFIVPDTGGFEDVFVRDRVAATTERVSVSTAGVQGNFHSGFQSISGDGRFVTFASTSTNLVASDTNAASDVFLRDRLSGTTERISLATGGTQGNSGSDHETAISTDGRFVAFSSAATNFVAGDTFGAWDIFVRDLVGLPLSYCTSSTSTNGCSTSIAASANPSVSFASACNLTVTSVDGQKSGLLLYGINNSGYTPLPWAPGSTSFVCVRQPVQRTPIQDSGGTLNACDGTFVLDWNAYQTANPLSLGNPWSVNAKVYVQAWFRDPPAAKTSNFSDAIELTYLP